MTKHDPKEKLDCFVSVVAVLRNKRNVVKPFLRNAHKHLDDHFSDYEIVLIDQCSEDGTAEQVDLLLQEIPSVRFIELAGPVDMDVALAAGTENAIGDFVILLTPGVDPVECIYDIVQQCQRGYDIVVGVASQPQTLGYKVIRPWIQWVLHKIGYDLPRNATTLRCLSRRAVNTVTETGRFHHQFFVRIAKTGYPWNTFSYSIKSETGVQRTLFKGTRQAIRLLVFNSTRPLRWMSGLGLLGSLMALVFASYSILIRFFKDDVIEGWTSMVFFMSLLFMLLFTILGFFGEYLGRLLDDRSEHRAYSVANETNSSVMLEEQRYNVLNESVKNSAAECSDR